MIDPLNNPSYNIMAIARNHHFLPQSYLGLFTDIKTKYGKFYVLETESGSCFQTSPKNVAVERDFNRLDPEGAKLDILVQSLSSFEGRAVEVCRKIIHTRTFPNAEDYNSLLNFICLIAVRNPQSQKSINRALEMILNLKTSHLVSDEEIWNTHLRRAQEAGYLSETNVSYEEIKKFVEARGYQIKFFPTNHFKWEFSAIDKLLPILGRRVWSLLLTPDFCPEFICSDHPVVLSWKDAEREGPIGFGLENTEIFFPISPQIGFYGVYEEPWAQLFTINSEQIARMNSLVERNAERHGFSRKPNYLSWYEKGIRDLSCWPKSSLQEERNVGQAERLN